MQDSNLDESDARCTLNPRVYLAMDNLQVT